MIALSEVQDARVRLGEFVGRTPVLEVGPLNELAGCALYLKCELFQPTGSFKVRGASNVLLSLTAEERARGVVTHSSGNHGAALAWACRRLGIEARIVMPDNATERKVKAVRAFGINPILVPPATREAEVARCQAETGAVLVHPYDDLRTMAGQGTIGLELLEQIDALDVVLVPLGGGGLLSGILAAIKHRCPQIQVVGVEPARADDAYRSWKSGERKAPLHHDSIADGLRAALGERPFEVIRALVDDILLVSEDAIAEAVTCFRDVAKLLVEPSGAIPLAAVFSNRARFQSKRVALILTGGNADVPEQPMGGILQSS